MHSPRSSAPGIGLVLLPRLVVGARRRRPVAPARLDAQVANGGGELLHAGEDRQLGLVDAPELLGAGVDVDERLPRRRRRRASV